MYKLGRKGFANFKRSLCKSFAELGKTLFAIKKLQVYKICRFVKLKINKT